MALSRKKVDEMAINIRSYNLVSKLHYGYENYLLQRSAEIASANGSPTIEVRHVELAAKEPYVPAEYK